MSRHRILELGLVRPMSLRAAWAMRGLCRGQHARTARLQGCDHRPQRRAALPLGFALVANAHDFGTYRTLWLVSADLPLPEDALAWLDNLVEPATWIAADFRSR
ncbi:hypothetical protein [Croceicoccus naphthovorans]|uniref:hypothetical protein n=1 Tax=Croceicoccus naphthovorans TaxID=1348774 RepID=UPI000B05AB7A|nr:hypothetical protein [Croceicoccus naphthovorans]